MKKAVSLLVSCGLLLAASPALGASPTMRGNVGPSDTIAGEMRGSFTVPR